MLSPLYDALVTGSDPLGGGEFPFGDLSKLFGAFGNSDPWQQAAQIAQAVASDGESEPNVEPKVRIALQDLARVALLYLAEVPGVRGSRSEPIWPCKFISSRCNLGQAAARADANGFAAGFCQAPAVLGRTPLRMSSELAEHSGRK